jgi:hypothetical protein
MSLIGSLAIKAGTGIVSFLVQRTLAIRWFGYQWERLRDSRRQQPGWRLCPECRGTLNARYGTCLFCQESAKATGVPSGYVRVETFRKDWDIWQWQARPGTPGNWQATVPASVLLEYAAREACERREYREQHKREHPWWREIF